MKSIKTIMIPEPQESSYKLVNCVLDLSCCPREWSSRFNGYYWMCKRSSITLRILLFRREFILTMNFCSNSEECFLEDRKNRRSCPTFSFNQQEHKETANGSHSSGPHKAIGKAKSNWKLKILVFLVSKE